MLQVFNELLRGQRQLVINQHLEQVTKVVSSVEGDPVDIRVDYKPGAHQKIPKDHDINSLFFQLVEIYSRLLKQ